MGSTKEIQTRMKSIQDTMKITNAMYMISSSKMQKAKRILSDTEPYYYNMQAAISRILRHMPDTEHPFFSIRHKIAEEDRKIGCIVVTGDKGMAGAYNHNIQKMTEQFMAEHEHCKLYVLGMVGRQYFTKKHMDIAGVMAAVLATQGTAWASAWALAVGFGLNVFLSNWNPLEKK